MDRIIGIAEAAKIRGQSREGILKAVRSGRLYAVSLSGKGLMLSERQVSGKPFCQKAFGRMCSKYCSVPDACNIVFKVDSAVIRDLRSGRIEGFQINSKCWAVLRSSAEAEFRDYLENQANRVGRKRDVGATRSPRDLRKTVLKRRAG